MIFANGLLHTAAGVVQGGYNTGLWSAAFLFIPLSVWVIYACVIRGPYSGKVVGVAFAAGASLMSCFSSAMAFSSPR